MPTDFASTEPLMQRCRGQSAPACLVTLRRSKVPRARHRASGGLSSEVASYRRAVLRVPTHSDGWLALFDGNSVRLWACRWQGSCFSPTRCVGTGTWPQEHQVARCHGSCWQREQSYQAVPCAGIGLCRVQKKAPAEAKF